MGIEGLYPFIRKRCPNQIKPCKLIDFKGKKLVFDANSLVYKFRFGNRPYTHIIEFGRLYCELRLLNITPVFIFDGIHPKEKSIENEKRNNNKRKFLESTTVLQDNLKKIKIDYGFDPNLSIYKFSFDSLSDEKKNEYKTIQKLEDDLDLYYKSKIIVNPEHILESQTILKLLGAPVLIAPDEAEAYASLMNRLNYSDYVVSEDADVFPFGANKLIRGIGWTNNRNNKLEQYDIDSIKNQLNISHDELINICVLCPNDFNKHFRVKGLGILKSYNTIKKYKSIENFFKNSNISENYENIKNLFTKYSNTTIIPEEFQSITINKPNKEECIEFFKNNLLNSFELNKWFSDLENC